VEEGWQNRHIGMGRIFAAWGRIYPRYLVQSQDRKGNAKVPVVKKVAQDGQVCLTNSQRQAEAFLMGIQNHVVRKIPKLI